MVAPILGQHFYKLGEKLDHMNRRTFIAGTVAVAVPIPGCSTLTGPDPEVVEGNVERGFTDVIGGTAEFEITVRNNGGAGDVSVEVILEDEGGTVLGRESETVHMEEDERRRVTITAEIPEDTADYRVEAEAA